MHKTVMKSCNHNENDVDFPSLHIAFIMPISISLQNSLFLNWLKIVIKSCQYFFEDFFFQGETNICSSERRLRNGNAKASLIGS